MGILAWQLIVFFSVLFSRTFSRSTMYLVAIGWTLFTFLAVWASWLVVLQLCTAWGAVWLVDKVSGASAEPIGRSGATKPVQTAGTSRPKDASVGVAPEPGPGDTGPSRPTLSELLDQARERQPQPQPQPQPRPQSPEPQPEPQPRPQPPQPQPHQQQPQPEPQPQIQSQPQLRPAVADGRTEISGATMSADRALIHSVVAKYAAAKAPPKPNLEPEPADNNFASTAASSTDVPLKDFLAPEGLERAVKARRIPNLVHFTRCENLSSILQHGLYSIDTALERGVVPVTNDKNRYDGQADGTSLSISFPNSLMFYKYRMADPKTRWAMVLIDPAVIYEKRCGFYPLNAADARMSRQPREAMRTTAAFERMFTEDLSARPPYLRSHDATDVQAEVMVYDDIGPEYFQGVVFETLADLAIYREKVPGLEVFAVGKGEGLFGTRDRRLRSLA